MDKRLTLLLFLIVGGSLVCHGEIHRARGLRNKFSSSLRPSWPPGPERVGPPPSLENSLQLEDDPDPIFLEPAPPPDNKIYEFGQAVQPPTSDHEPSYPRLPTKEEGAQKEKHTSQQWILSMVSAMLVGLSGIFPLLVIPLETGEALRRGAGAARLRLLLSFAVGGLLGDVFLHLLPEAWAHLSVNDHEGHMWVGLWVILGLLAFLLVEKVFPDDDDEEEEEEEDTEVNKSTEAVVDDVKTTELVTNGYHKANGVTNGYHKINGVTNGYHEVNGITNGYQKANGVTTNGCVTNELIEQAKNELRARNGLTNGHTVANGHSIANGLKNGHAGTNGYANGHANGHPNGYLPQEVPQGKEHKAEKEKHHIKTSGWLNLLANVIDNFTHGLAVAGSYCVSTKVGLITTLAVLLHEVPHEVGDFAILLRSGFDRWQAAKAQLLTASGGLLGALCALMADSAQAAGDRTAWVLPFTSGGFIYIALVTVVPDLLKETSPRESVKQILLLLTGIAVMFLVTLLCD